MKAKQSKFKQILPKVISAFLVFWLSSVLVLVCCGLHLWTASASNVAVEEENSCPTKGHECCKKNKDAKNLSKTESDKADCCVFKPRKTLSADLQNQQNVKQSQTVAEKINLPQPVYFIKNSYKSPSVYHSSIRNRGSTYLINCNFRI